MHLLSKADFQKEKCCLWVSLCLAPSTCPQSTIAVGAFHSILIAVAL